MTTDEAGKSAGRGSDRDHTVYRRMRSLAGRLRHAIDRVLHPLRRRRALALLEQRPPSQVLFVCLGNICRSPYAAYSFQRRIADRSVRVQSAGFIGPGRAVPGEGQRVALLHGIDLSNHRSQLMTQELVRGADLIVVMATTQRRSITRTFGRRSGILVLGDLDDERIGTRTVLDPYSRSEDVFEAVYTRIDRCIDALVAALPVTERV